MVTTKKTTEQILREIVKTNTPVPVKGTVIDIFTANLILTVLDRLNESNKESLLASSIEEMVAVSFKIITH